MAQDNPTAPAPVTASATAMPAAVAGEGLSGSAGPAGMIRQFLNQPAISRAMPLIILSAIVLAAISAWLVLREPPQRELFRGLSDNDKAAVVQALDSAGIPYQVDNISGTLKVSDADYHTAKIQLAGQGLPRTAPSGDSIVSSMPMGASRAVESEKLRAAREMDLARSIEALDNVLSARVHLAVEQPSLFLRDRNEPAASVILQLAGAGSLDERQTQAILNLVASSVPGLSASNVSVIDQNGRLLSSDSAALASHTDKNLKTKTAIEDRYRQSLASLLTPIVGPGNFVAEVSAEVDFDKKQAASEIYPAEGSVLRSERGMRSEEPLGSSRNGGIPGALANRPPAEAEFGDEIDGAEDEGEQQAEPMKTAEEYQRNFELAREIAVTQRATGQVSRLSVAVAIDEGALKSRAADKDIEQLESLIKSTVGFDAERGDQIAVTSRQFETIEQSVAEEAWYETSWFSLVTRNVSALIVALIVIFGIGRPLLKRWMKDRKEASTAALPAPTIMAEGQLTNETVADVQGGDNRSAENAGALPPPVTIDMIQAAPSYQERALLTQNFVKQNPDHAALVVKELLKESKDLENSDG